MPSPRPSPLKDLNHVIAREDYIEVVWDGPQDSNTVRQTNIAAAKAAELLKSKGKPILLSLHVINHPIVPSMGAFREVMKIFRAASLDRISISGTVSPMLMTLISTIINSFNRELEIAYFADQKDALAWLLQPKK